MDAFEQIVALVARNKGYWTTMNLRIELSGEEKRSCGLSLSCPRWEFDVVAFSPQRNELLAIECKSFLYSKGVWAKDGKLQKEDTYKLFNDRKKRDVVLHALKNDLVRKGLCHSDTTVKLVLAAGNVYAGSRDEVDVAAREGDWVLWSDHEMAEGLLDASDGGYENDASMLATRITSRYLRRDRFVGDADGIEIVSR